MNDTQSYVQGIVAAAAVVVRTHDRPTIAESILDENAVSRSSDLLRQCSEYDLAPLREAGVIPSTIIGQ